MYKTSFISAITFAFFTSLAVAETDTSDYQLEPIVITATRTLQTMDQNIAPVIVITSQDIEQSQASDVAELLSQHAGLEIGRNGGPGQTASLFIRGTNSNQVLLMIDGVKVNSGTTGAPTWQFLSPQMIERIEVVKGPRSSLYGSEALGGVVNIITKRGARGQHWQASAGFGAQHTEKYDAGYQVKSGSLRMGVHGESFITDGFAPVTFYDVGGGYKNNSVSTYIGYELERLDTELSTWQSSGNSKYTSYGTPLDQDFNNGTTALKTKYRLNNWNQTLTLSNITNKIHQNQSADFIDTNRNAVDWQNDITLGKQQQLTGGLYYSQENDTSLSFGTAYDQNTAVKAAYLQDNANFGSHQMVVAGRITNQEDFGTQDSYNIDYRWAATSSLNVLAGVGKGFRAPNASERFGPGGSSKLKPETSQNLELGLKYKIDRDQHATLSIFQNKIKNLIQWQTLEGRLVNVGRARIRGVELGYTYLLRPFSFSLEGLFQTPENENTKELLLRRAKRSFTSRLSYTKNSTTYGIEALYSSNRKDYDYIDYEKITDLPAYSLVNLYMTDKLATNWSLNLKIDNMFNRHYQLASGYNTQGLLALMEIKYSAHDL